MVWVSTLAVMVLQLTYVASSSSSGCTGSVSQAEYNALESLYNSAGGKDWAWDDSQPPSTQWSFPVDLSVPCSDNWQGLVCALVSFSVCAIQEVELSAYNLRGTITDSAFNMTSLTTLNLAENELRGSIPSTIQLLSSLAVLALYGNTFTGSIPAQIGALTSLTDLYLYSNDLDGSIPTEIGLCTSLVFLEIDDNQLSRAVPSEIGLLTRIKFLYLYENALSKSIPTEIGFMSSLLELSLFENSLRSSLPTQLGMLQQLTQLRVDDNLLTGAIPTELGLLTSMELAYFFGNSLNGPLPTQLGRCTALSDLEVYDNILSGPLPSELGLLSLLSQLDINNNRFKGQLPSEIGSCSSLEDLYLYSNSFSGTIPGEFGNLRNLVFFELDDNYLSGGIPTELGKMTSVVLLYLYDNKLHGTFPTELGNLVSLSEISIESNSLTGSLPTEIGALTKLKTFSLQNNYFSSSLPTAVGQLTVAVQIYLYDNQFSQSLPSQVGLLSNLVILYLYSNQFDGSIPVEMTNLRSLAELELSDNALSGTVPPGLGDMVSLTQLYLNSNYLTGSIESLFSLESVSLVNLSLYENLLTGTLPSEVGRLTSLVGINLGVNSLSGTLPTQLGMLTALETLLVDLNSFSGLLPPLCASLSMSDFSISENIFSGPFPSEIGCWTLATDLVFSTNFLSGSIPSEVGKLTGLVDFELNDNAMTGTIPPEIGELKLLNILSLEYNSFTGTIPTEIGLLKQLLDVDAADCFFTGQIPTEIGELKFLLYFNVEHNSLTGPIPTELNSLTSLNSFQALDNLLSNSLPNKILAYMSSLLLCDNVLTGPLPTEYGQKNLVFLMLCGNYLSGSIPSEISNAAELYYLALNENLLRGDLPTSLRNCSQLLVLDVRANRLAGTVPFWLFVVSPVIASVLIEDNGFHGTLPTQYANSLTEILVDVNRITGTIASEIALATALTELELGGNQLTGTIPSEFSALRELISVSFDHNELSGTIPAQISAWVNAVSVTMEFCSLTGTFPSQLSSLAQLIEWTSDSNFLTGSIPVDFANSLNPLQGLFIYSNYLTGSIPSCLSEPTELSIVWFNNNFISGTLAAALISNPAITQVIGFDNMISGTLSITCTNSSVLHSLCMYSNLLSGVLPSSLGECNQLQELMLGYNEFEGTLPSELRYLQWLQVLNCTNCNFYGQVSGLFAESSFLPNLTVIDLSNNAFSGTIPQGLFNANKSNLSEVILFSNCFTGSLPDDICDAKSITTLVLDSVTSAPSCDLQYSHFADTLLAYHLLSGTIPDCVWSLGRMHTLHLSGNGLIGTLPELPADSILTDVSLANNKIRGTIPDSWQKFGRFTNLALQSNRISGTLHALFNVSRFTRTLDLSVNRLSGEVPSTFYQTDGINVLDGNLFQCRNNNKPKHDPSSVEYTCGSSDLNSSLYAWLAALGLLLLVVMTAFGLKHMLSLLQQTRSELTAALETDAVSHHATLNCLSRLNSLSLCARHAACWSLVFVLPTYLALKLGSSNEVYSTHTFQYAWVASAGYLHGALPCTLVCTFLSVSVCQIATLSSASPQQKSCPVQWTRVVFNSLGSRQLYLSVVLLIIHSVVMLGVNIAYIAAAFDGVSASQLNAVQFCLCVFNGFWKEVFVGYVMKKLHSSFAPSGLLFMAVYIKIFTFLISPTIATLVSDSTCFRYLFTDQPDVSAVFVSEIYNCGFSLSTDPDGAYSLNQNCLFVPSDVSVYKTTPVWLYSYQCSSALLTNYVSVIVYSYVISGIIYPLCGVLYSSSFSKPMVRWIQTHMPDRIREKYFDKSLYSWNIHLWAATTSSGVPPEENALQPTKLFSAVRLYSRYLVNMSVMVTFGLAYPLLTVVIAADSMANLLSILLLKLRLVRMGLNNGDNAIFQSCCRVIDAAANIDDIDVGNCLLLLVLIAESFWVIFVFDMVGDVYGAKVGAVAVLGPTLGVHLLFLLWKYTFHHIMTSPQSLLARTLSGDVQLDTVYRINSITSSIGANSIQRTVTNPIIAPDKDSLNEQFGENQATFTSEC
jgi:Leucine-rich repeat (LRR) protein